MATTKINLTLPEGEVPVTGKQITFISPCDSASGLTYLLLQDTKYLLVDSNGGNIVNGSFKANSMVSVILNVESKKAYIQNSDYTKNISEELGSKANASTPGYPTYEFTSEVVVPRQYTADIAILAMVGGITKKSKNHLPYPYKTNPDKVKTQTISGVTFKDNGDGSLTLNGTSTAVINYEFVAANSFGLPAGEYQVSKGNDEAQGYMQVGGTDTIFSKILSGDQKFTLEQYSNLGICNYQIPKNKTFSNVTIYPQINIGYGDKDFEPYFAGLRSASVTSIETISKNVFSIDYYSASGNPNSYKNTYGTTISTIEAVNSVTVTQSQNSYTIPDEPKNRKNGFVDAHFKEQLKDGQVYTISFDIQILENPFNVDSVKVYFNGLYPVSYVSTNDTPYKKGAKYRVEARGIYTPYSNHRFIEIYTCGMSFVLSNIQIEEGETTTDYTSFRKNHYLIPESVTSLKDYGLGIDTHQYYNYVDFSRKQFVRRVHKIVLDGVTEGRKITGVSTISTGLVFGQLILDRRCDITITNDTVLLCSHFKSGSANIGNCYISGSANHFLIMYHYDQTIQDVDTWNSWLHEQYLAGNPVTCVYILETQETVDISESVLEDALRVEPRGTIKLISEYGYDVPSAYDFNFSKNERLDAKSFVGELKGKATFADKATCAVYDDKGNHISTTYALAPIISSEDITAGSTNLTTGKSYHVYE